MPRSFWLFLLLFSLVLLIGSAAPALAQQVSVPVTFHRQEHSLSCEVATLKMALGAHGIAVNEPELIAHLPVDATPRSSGIWGNPYTSFVGNIDGVMPRTGYGVYWDPIAKLGQRYADTEVLRHSSAPELAKHLTQGNPVIVWGYYGTGAALSWQTPQGVPVKAVNGEHTRVVYGFDGPVNAPTHFYLMDPLTGPLKWTTAQLMHNWGALDHMAVVVRPQPRWVRVQGETDIWEISQGGKTRHLVIDWETFIERGGSPEAVRAIIPRELAAYREGSTLK
jgi:uncharacterized protein YvpB